MQLDNSDYPSGHEDRPPRYRRRGVGELRGREIGELSSSEYHAPSDQQLQYQYPPNAGFAPPGPYDPSWPAPGTPATAPAGGTPRTIGAPTVVSILLCLPTLITSAIVVAGISSLFGSTIGLISFLAWLASGALIFNTACEEFLAAAMFHLRRPTSRELYVVNPLWARVCFRAAIDPEKFSLWIDDRDSVNASASAGHIVAITPQALGMPPEIAEAILAHELGHHLKGHPLVGMLTYWYSLPARLAYRIAMFVFWLIVDVGKVLLTLGFAAGIVFVAVAAVLALVFAPWALIVFTTPVLYAWSVRLEELQADDVAFQLGYGNELRTFFYQAMAMENNAERRRSGLYDRLLKTHPSASKRVARLEARLMSLTRS